MTRQISVLMALATTSFISSTAQADELYEHERVVCNSRPAEFHIEKLNFWNVGYIYAQAKPNPSTYDREVNANAFNLERSVGLYSLRSYNEYEGQERTRSWTCGEIEAKVDYERVPAKDSSGISITRHTNPVLSVSIGTKALISLELMRLDLRRVRIYTDNFSHVYLELCSLNKCVEPFDPEATLTTTVIEALLAK